MDIQFSENKLIALYLEIDDLYLAYQRYRQEQGHTPSRNPTRTTQLSAPEICTILVAYNYSGYKCFEYYYKQIILTIHRDYFPDAPSYERFLAYITRAIDLMYLWLLYGCGRAQRSGLYFIDAKQLPVCHLRREHSHRVFQEIAGKGKSSTGWFYGLKLHMVINNVGEIIAFHISSGNVADNNQAVLQRLLAQLQGFCIGDKGYLSKLFASFYENGLHLLTRPRKNMKACPVLPLHNKLINLRAVIESVFDILTTVCDIEHTRHRNPINAYTHMLASLVAYQHMEQKPSVYFPSTICSEKNICAPMAA